jgi:PKHD-type hydroxylase
MTQKNYAIIDNFLSSKEIQTLIDENEKLPKIQAAIVDDQVNTDARKVFKREILLNSDLINNLWKLSSTVNAMSWNFDLSEINQIEYLTYEIDGKYESHIDTSLGDDSPISRKLTTVIFLNDDFSGGRFYIQCGASKNYPKQTPGTAVVFPSFLLHGVEPIYRGIRKSIVAWTIGPRFR